ncbi:hypothetical protein PROFUN_06076 [Planoprotostelium fungivorum]|uniref:Uncharacterized protein n=1 Tax=Planoprotostelium fungivorum TaxID=1890364 RepID=A0A2P6NPS5_9EUKA|nr:hypothetical protein PROFUN_06076 [Planoprotostelium fungivorum]
MGLLRLEILDAKGGVCLYEKVWKWSGIGASPEGLCKLVLTFYQISKEVGDEGGVSQVIFDNVEKNLPKDTLAAQSQGSGKGSKANTGMGTRYIGSLKNRYSTRHAQSSIRLAASRNKDIIVAIFHELTDELESVKKVSKQLLDQFESQFGGKMKDVKNLIEQAAEDERKTKEVMSEFVGFEKTALNIAAQFSTQGGAHDDEDDDERSMSFGGVALQV